MPPETIRRVRPKPLRNHTHFRILENRIFKEVRMDGCPVEIVIPEKCRHLDQNEEWIKIVTDDGEETVRLHDYGRFYEIPGLYDNFYKSLNCQSPRVVCETLKSQMVKCGWQGEPVRALDLGAGNGQVGEMLTRQLDCEAVVGLDIIDEAREAAERDRPEVYADYYVMDLADPTEDALKDLSRWNFNTLVTVAALGFGDIGTRAFLNAYNLLPDDAWVAFNIKDRFLSDSDDTGFSKTMNKLLDDSFELLESRRYCHRLSLAGAPLHYYVIVGRKNGAASKH
jgi:SAM-dependent methyltransferase